MKTLMILLLATAVILTPTSTPAQGVEQKVPPPRPPGGATSSDPGMRTGHLVRGSAYLGEAAPDFELEASTGATLRLSRQRATWVLLVFGGRKEDLAPLNTEVVELRSIGVEMIGVCDEKAYHLRSFAEQGKMKFPLLADVTGEISALYGLYDTPRATTSPGFFLIDTTGVVRMALLGQHIPGKDMTSLARFGVEREAR
jgi:peroxiredoxin